MACGGEDQSQKQILSMSAYDFVVENPEYVELELETGSRIAERGKIEQPGLYYLQSSIHVPSETSSFGHNTSRTRSSLPVFCWTNAFRIMLLLCVSCFPDKDYKRRTLNYFFTLQSVAVHERLPPRVSAIKDERSEDVEDVEQKSLQLFSVLPLFLKFESVEYSVIFKLPSGWNARKALSKVMHSKQNRGDEKTILNGITGCVAPGEILAMMGPSGSGKTTLLKILGGRLQKNVRGSITYNETPYSGALKRRIGFVTQDDVLFPYLTVRESLVWAALLRLPNNMSFEHKLLRADKVLKDLGLERCQNTIVGGPFICGVSGGERKRTSIGSEILIDPSMLLLDEPTSGLDSATALRILFVLQSIAQGGRTIIMTIHQPSSRMFHMFDKLILISEGHTLYSGHAKDALSYFACLGFSPQITMNPADFLLDLAAGVIHDITYPEELQQDFYTDVTSSNPENRWAGSHMGERKVVRRTASESIDPFQRRSDFLKQTVRLGVEDLQREIVKYLRMKYRTELESREKERLRIHDKVSQHLKDGLQGRPVRTSSWQLQFFVLFKRTFKERYRDYFDSIKFVQAIGVSIVLGLLWWQSKLLSERDIRDQVGLLFYISIFWSSSALFSSVSTFPLERSFLVKEMEADMYHLSAYYASSTLCDILSEIIYPTIFIASLYFMAGLRKTFLAFLQTLLATYIIVIASQGVGDFFGAAIMDVKKSGIVASLVLLIFLLTGGYYVQHMPVFMAWMKYLSFILYGYRLLLKIQYSPEQMYDCFSPSGCKSFAKAPPFHDLDLNGGGEEVWILLLMAIAYRVLALIFLHTIKTRF